MKTRITKLFILILAVAVMGVAGLGGVQPVEAQLLGDGSVKFITYTSVGLVEGERVRLSVATPEQASGSATLSFSYYIAHETNSWSCVHESGPIRVPPGQFRSSEIARKDLDLVGEPKTGRAQLLVGVSMMLPAGSDPRDFPAAMEIIRDDVEDGATEGASGNSRIVVILTATPPRQIVPMSFGPGEKLRYSVLYPNEAGSKPVRVTSYTYDNYGNLLRQTDPMELKPGQSHVVDVDRDDLPLPGDDKTGLLQVRPVIKIESIDGSVDSVKLPISIETINRTGSSSGGSYFTGTLTVSGDGW